MGWLSRTSLAACSSSLPLQAPAASLSLTRDKETLFLPIFRPGKGHSPEAHGSDRAQTSTTDLQTGANTGATSSLTCVKVMGQGNEEVNVGQFCWSIPHPLHPSLKPLCNSIFSFSLNPHFLSSSFPSSSLFHIVLPSVPPLCLATFPSLHPLVPHTPGTQRGAGNLPCLILGPPLLGHLIFTTERNISRRIGRTFNWKWKFYDSSHSAQQITPAEKTWKQMNNL